MEAANLRKCISALQQTRQKSVVENRRVLKKGDNFPKETTMHQSVRKKAFYASKLDLNCLTRHFGLRGLDNHRFASLRLCIALVPKG